MEKTNENILAIDVGGSTIKYAISNPNGELFNKNNFPTPNSLEKLYEEFEKIFNSNKPLQGIALSMPGSVDTKKGIITGSSALKYIHNKTIKKDLETKLKTKISMENDANCAALAEIWKGEAKEVEDCCLVVCGTGIGGAIVKNRKIHHGKNLHGGEFGYLILGLDEKNEPIMWSFNSTVNVVEKVAKAFNLSVEEMTGKSRVAHIKTARQVAMFLLSDELGLSTTKIALEVGVKDHTTVMHGIRKIKEDIKLDFNLREQIMHIRENLYV